MSLLDQFFALQPFKQCTLLVFNQKDASFGSIAAMSADRDFENALGGQLGAVEELFNEGKTEHADDAIDFEDEDELAEEEEATGGPGEDDGDEEDDGEADDGDFMKDLQNEAMEGVEDDEDAELAGNMLGLPTHNAGLNDMHFAEDHNQDQHDSDLEDASMSADDYTSQQRYKYLNRKEENDEKLLRVFFPSFKRGEPMKLQTLFPTYPLDYTYQQPKPVRGPMMPKTLLFEVESDTRKELRMTNKQYMELQSKRGIMSLPPRDTFEVINEEKIVKVDDSSIEKAYVDYKTDFRDYDYDLVLASTEWNDEEIIFGNAPKRVKLAADSFNLDDWQDNDEMIFNGTIDVDLMNLRLDLNDSKMVVMEKEKPRSQLIQNLAVVPNNQKIIEQRFNISNDSQYEFLKNNYQIKVRATIGTMIIDHAPPASRLQTPYYKVRPPAKQNRLYHRPRFSIRSGTTMQFSRLKNRKKKKDRGKDINQIFKDSRDLTLSDTGNIFVMEYSEEYPLSMSKFGMGSKIINYYRKIHDDDTNRPKLPIGETTVLGVQDRSPFWNFGFVESGTIVPALYNHMIRAPIFKQESYSTDFLLIRSHGGGSNTRYYMRSINQLFTVGQCYPAQEVPGPHSRKVTTINKNRLKMVVFRAVNNNPRQRIVVKDISVHFPDQSDMQNRQKLKEFMEYQRQGEDQGHWKVKSSELLLDYDQIRKLVTPDDICLMEMMLMGQQRFEDLESFRIERLEDLDENGNKKETKDSKEQEEDMAHKLAPWNTTKNFIQATQNKAMLQIHGEGDPSHKGEAISFLRTSMKGGFLKNVESSTPQPQLAGNSDSNSTPIPHSYNVAQQQKLYDDEIKKVWYKQRKNLSKQSKTGFPIERTDKEMRDVSYMRRADKIINDEVNEKPRFLKITRLVKNEYGIKERKVVIIKDPKVVELYVKRKQELLLKGTDSSGSGLVLTNDSDENLKVKKKLEEELAKLEKLHEKKKKKVPMITAANIDSEGRISGKGIGKGKSTLRRCATCGELGHIRTNKTCRLYYTVHNKSNPNYNGSSAIGNMANSTPAPTSSSNK